ncbi:MAG: orotidine-5'-phosphate decarboxylase [Caldithrix sp.]|nr:MAG: orotidine-5'-phosphate decarboxylase [Caldithrix sp.]
MNFYQRFQQITREQNSLLCVGLDPDMRRLPESIKSDPDPLFKFCAEIIESTKHVAAAFKPNFAFFEAHGSKGWAALEKLVDLIPDNIMKLADAKRADIGSTSEMYARAIFEKLSFDAVTVNPYLGRDSVEPFLQWPEKGAFILGITSNPGSKDFQHLQVGSEPVYKIVIRQVTENWNTQNNCGLVVGATHPEELAEVRKLAPGIPFLIPGIGAQGGDLEQSVLNGTDESGGLALFNSSRGIIYKSSGSDFAEAAGREAELLNKQINEIRKDKRFNTEEH